MTYKGEPCTAENVEGGWYEEPAELVSVNRENPRSITVRWADGRVSSGPAILQSEMNRRRVEAGVEV